MSFELKSVVPWGRNLEEYKSMFHLTEADLDKQIISFGDGPASFNFEMTSLGKSCTSIDPIYDFTKNALQNRFKEVKDEVIEQLRKNLTNFVWNTFKDLNELEIARISSMNKFLSDFEKGKKEGRYITHRLPEKTKFENQKFELGLSSHFLLLYENLGLEFHILSIVEMLRISKEIRIFPIVNLNGERCNILNDIIKYFKSQYHIEIQKVSYEFQKDGNEMIVFNRNSRI